MSSHKIYAIAVLLQRDNTRWPIYDSMRRVSVTFLIITLELVCNIISSDFEYYFFFHDRHSGSLSAPIECSIKRHFCHKQIEGRMGCSSPQHEKVVRANHTYAVTQQEKFAHLMSVEHILT